MKKGDQYFQYFQDGREKGLKYFISLFGKPLRFYAYSIVRDKEAAEEIVSDSFYKLWERRDRIESIERIKPFLYIVTRNACYDYIGASVNNIMKDDDALNFEKCNDTDILTQIIYSELVELIVKELEKLPAQQASIFHMIYLEGLSTKEICETLNTSSSNVYFAKSKATNTLRKVFEQKKYKLYAAYLFFFIQEVLK